MAPSTKGSAGYTKEGFEETIGTNHLGHFLLANLLIKVRTQPSIVSAVAGYPVYSSAGSISMPLRALGNSGQR